MPDSYIDQKTDMMHHLLWNNILKQIVIVELAAVPYLGPFLSWGPVRETILFVVSNYVEIPLFRALVRWGVFTSVDWQEDRIYSAYEIEAEKLLPLHGKPEQEWTKEEEKEFADAAENLIHFHIPGWSA